MERICANLYRFDFGPIPFKKAGFRSHAYLLVRKAGNLLVCHCQHGSTVTDHFDQIERLGGVQYQFVAHHHDARRGDLHQLLYDRFGCKLCYHRAERKAVRAKTQCPAEEFGDEGLTLGRDFEAIYFPGHTAGMSIFQWRYRGKHLLFPSHVIGLDGGEWRVNLNPHIAPSARPVLRAWADTTQHYLCLGGSLETEESVQDLTAASAQALSAAIKTKLSPGDERSATSRRPKAAANYLPQTAAAAIKEMGPFDYEKMVGHGKCKMDLLLGYIADSDVLLFQDFNRQFGAKHRFWDALRTHVEEGGGLYIGDSRPLDPRTGGLTLSGVFAEVAQRGEPTPLAEAPRPTTDELSVSVKHPAVGNLAKNSPVRTEAYDHLTFAPGPKGRVLATNAFGDPVLVAGEVGQGRVLFSALRFGEVFKIDPAVGDWVRYYKTPIEGAELQLFEGALRWLARLDD